MTEEQINNNQRIQAIQLRLGEIAGRLDRTVERTHLKAELAEFRLREDMAELKTTPDSVWETLRKIAAMGDTLNIMCEDRTIDHKVLMIAGFRGAVRLAKQALKDAGK